jgi:hypothetical protein
VHAVQESPKKCWTLLPALIRRTISPALFRRTLSPTLFESHPASEKGEHPFRLRFTKEQKEKMECYNHHRCLRSFYSFSSFSIGWFYHVMRFSLSSKIPCHLHKKNPLAWHEED